MPTSSLLARRVPRLFLLALVVGIAAYTTLTQTKSSTTPPAARSGPTSASTTTASSTPAPATTATSSAQPRTEPRSEPPTTSRARDAAPGDRSAPTTSDTSPSPPAASTLRIGSWNIEWLGEPENRSGVAANVAQSPDDIAGYILESRVAILGVCEVVTRLPGRPIRSRELEEVVAAMKRVSGAQWEYVLFPGRSDGDQLTGVLWDTSRVTAINPDGKPWKQAVDQPEALAIPRGRSSQGSSLWNRPPHAMKFSLGAGKTDLVVVVIHMKADYQGDFAVHRREEAVALVKALPSLRESQRDADIVILGDSNCVSTSEPALKVFADSGFTDLNASGQQTHWRGGSMDRILVPTGRSAFAASKLVVHSTDYLRAHSLRPEDFKRRLSDHYLVYTTVAVGADDDK